MDDPLAHVAFDLDCAKMTPSYVAQCIRAVTSGTCTQYRLTWERLCFKTCAALPGVLCTQYSREKWCSHDPDGTCGESLCNQFMNNYCSVAFEDVTTLRKKVDRNPAEIAAAEGYGISVEGEIGPDGSKGDNSGPSGEAGDRSCRPAEAEAEAAAQAEGEAAPQAEGKECIGPQSKAYDFVSSRVFSMEKIGSHAQISQFLENVDP